MKKFLPLFVLSVFSLLLLTPTVFASTDLGSLQESIGIGKILSVGLPSSTTGTWYLTSNSDSSVASAAVASGKLVATGVTTGASVIVACTAAGGSDCFHLSVTVSVPQSILGAAIIAHHQFGSWVLQGQTVYYVDVSGLIPVSTAAIFLSNGGQWSALQPINSGDQALPLESLMVAHDLRLQKERG